MTRSRRSRASARIRRSTNATPSHQNPTCGIGFVMAELARNLLRSLNCQNQTCGAPCVPADRASVRQGRRRARADASPPNPPTRRQTSASRVSGGMERVAFVLPPSAAASPAGRRCCSPSCAVCRRRFTLPAQTTHPGRCVTTRRSVATRLWAGTGCSRTRPCRTAVGSCPSLRYEEDVM